MDVVWCLIMKNVWDTRPFINPNGWKKFAHIRLFTLGLSYVNVVLKCTGCAFLVPMYLTASRLTLK